ncbi:adenosylcobinamide-GDP ribazoletransferase [Aestuariirhabdus litorea]|uniref:Adenosylcobinamide-GDP ribazoletransferase n=1 Tax=Aestuariirhabdus litorea TaxID=2528527 RepID=A0A3P3VRM7_9GAMM|nr:adenosylcobinamide-GDP ribazoletransferase [Aestuariirhabdus litorea]RRJ84638.1 adenosylcobinamide-GDP ribazoletransferase [Aestuariirhabdus litorea]RWW97863.1 adenosylcobinamide-GDP ribazoletransferase [Endozoicomonadaceae bacterium GTF-13]
MLDSLKLAIQFLTRIPVHLAQPPSERAIGRALLWYPLVGLLYGVVLVSVAILLDHLTPMGLSVTESFVVSALVLLLWVMLSGALHLDGLGDSADAWLGGGDRERTLAIMKDTHAGTGALVSVALVLLLKWSALQHLLLNQQYLALLLAPLWARTSVLVLFATTPYVRPNGLGASFSRYCETRELWAITVITLASIVTLFGGQGAALVLVAGGLFWCCRRLMVRRIGGTTGDTAGALIEVTEMAILVAAVFIVRMS